jgi:hypothetical protein
MYRAEMTRGFIFSAIGCLLSISLSLRHNELGRLSYLDAATIKGTVDLLRLRGSRPSSATSLTAVGGPPHGRQAAAETSVAADVSRFQHWSRSRHAIRTRP